ncbi:MAG: hypothetical protein LUQ18_02500 [Methylococcaceae bacterium]|nr:hypothetical protein [Methylococcaceae bacterium]
MNNNQANDKNDVTTVKIDPTPLPLPMTCAQIAKRQNAYLSGLCKKKVNKLSCRCSGCETDDRYPVIGSPSDAPLLNTAYDGNGGFLKTGKDSNWEVGIGDSSGPNSVPATSWIKAFVIDTALIPILSGAWANSSFNNANWISYFIDANQVIIDPDSTTRINGEDAYFRYRFNLSSSVNPSTFALNMFFLADNRVWEIYVNNVAQSTQSNGSGLLPQFPLIPPDDQPKGFFWDNRVIINLDNHWKPCNNELVIHVKSPSGHMGFLAQNAIKVQPDETGCYCPSECNTVELPSIKPCISVKWGDSPCDCLETDDVEILCITVCNCYANVTFSNLSIGQILITNMDGTEVLPKLPDGTSSVRVIPSGPICFGDIAPCTDNQPNCVSRELVLYTRGAAGKQYRLIFKGICFTVCHQFQSDQCFTMKLCSDE